jgi:hypothetical protein
MPSISTTHDALAAEDEFLAILCSDEELVRAEFDAIIAAEWPSLPPDPPADDDAPTGSPGPARHRARGARMRPHRPRHPGVGSWARERSPPARDNHNSRTREGDVPT